jgi:Ca2+/H+ antiporter
VLDLDEPGVDEAAAPRARVQRLRAGAIVLAVIIASHVTSQGESTWFEGVMLLALYVVLAATFLFA